MKHPPVPPNCPYFSNQDDAKYGALFTIEWYDSDVVIGVNGCKKCLLSKDAALIPVIAAVAEKYWNIEIERIRNDPAWLQDPRDQRTIPARENVQAWKEWSLK